MRPRYRSRGRILLLPNYAHGSHFCTWSLLRHADIFIRINENNCEVPCATLEVRRQVCWGFRPSAEWLSGCRACRGAECLRNARREVQGERDSDCLILRVKTLGSSSLQELIAEERLVTFLKTRPFTFPTAHAVIQISQDFCSPPVYLLHR